jgi:hypothetical protein
MEINGVMNQVWNRQVLGQEYSSTELQYQETHIGKKRKLQLTDGEESSSSLSLIEATFDQNIANGHHLIANGLGYNGYNNNISHSHLTNGHFNDQAKRLLANYSVASMFESNFISNENFSSRGNHHSQDRDIMGNPLHLSDEREESSDDLKHLEKAKKKKERRHRNRDDPNRKKELIALESSSDDSTSTSKEVEKKEPRIGTTYQCDMSVLNNGEGDRDEFLGEQMWDPSKVNIDSVDNFLQEVKLFKPLINQFEFEPFFEYIPAYSIIALDKLLNLLKKFNYNIGKTKRYLIEQKLDFSDRGFAVRQPWKIGEIKTFEKSLKFMFEEEGEFDLGDVKHSMPSKPMTQICEFYYAWKHSKRFQCWKEETNRTEFTNRKRSKAGLREVRRVDYNDQTSLILSNLNNRPHKSQKKPLEDSKVLQQISNEGDYMVYEIFVNVQINDAEFERKNCLKYITKRNVKTDKYFLEYS